MDIERLLRDLDAPRPLPAGMRARLEGSLSEPDAAEAWTPSVLAGADAPRPLPAGFRNRLEAAMGSGARRRILPSRLRLAGALAAVAAMLASVLVASRSPQDAAPPASPPRAASPAAPSDGALQPEAGTSDGLPRPADRLGDAGNQGEIDGLSPVAYPAPPFAFEAPRSVSGAPGARGALAVGVVEGNEALEAGFRAYLDALNDAGGVRGRRLEAVPVRAGEAVRNTIATVNLSGETIATPEGPPAWTTGPLLEGPAATEDVLRGSVFGLASAPERQARLLADAVFPEPDPGAVAVIYRGTEGVFADEVPRALRDVLEAREVTVVEAVYERGRPAPLVPADAAFLSMPKEDTLRFLSYAQRTGYHPPRAMGCLFPMLDLGLVDELDDGYLVMSPYSLGRGTERRALEGGSGRPASTDTIHGWTTAKSLAVALWRTGAEGPADAQFALRELEGYEGGFSPAIGFREGTNARTPEGILYEVRDGRFVTSSGFRTDGT